MQKPHNDQLELYTDNENSNQDDITTYAIGIEFIGTQYRGWQRQEEVLAIQEVIETVLSKIANEPIIVEAAGRTDAGVHASNMIAHFTSKAKRSVHNWLRGANTLLPDDIAIRWLTPISEDFHARFKAISRRYRYITLNQSQRPAILNKQVTHVYQNLDISLMQEAVKLIEGTHNFTSFRAAACQSRQPVRTVSHAKLFQHGSYLIFDIQADGFLHHMVRNLMGALYAVGSGEIPPQRITELLEIQDRTQAPATAKPHGLYFINAYYPKQLQNQLPKIPLTPLWLNVPE